jgi:hypothetical protein
VRELHLRVEAKTCQQRVAARPSALPDKGDPNGVITPVIEGTPVPVSEHEAVLPVDALPVVESGVDGLEEGSATRGVSVISNRWRGQSPHCDFGRAHGNANPADG